MEKLLAIVSTGRPVVIVSLTSCLISLKIIYSEFCFYIFISIYAKYSCTVSQMEGGSCDTTVRNAKVSYFMSPNYPNESGGDLICELNLELSEKTLGVKLDFVSLQMDSLPFDLADFAVSQTPVCGSDMLFIKGFQGWSPDLRCGNLTGYSSMNLIISQNLKICGYVCVSLLPVEQICVLVLVETEKGQKKLSLVFVMASSIYKWRIRLTQFTEDDVNSRGSKKKSLLENGEFDMKICLI